MRMVKSETIIGTKKKKKDWKKNAKMLTALTSGWCGCVWVILCLLLCAALYLPIFLQ